MPPITLAIEVSQRQAGVAVSDNQGNVYVEALRGDTRHDDDLMPAIDRLCTTNAITPDAIQAVGVSIGPGGFTGLRIAVTTAKMLALINPDVQIAAIPSALVAAHSTTIPDSALNIAVILAGKRETAWVTRCTRKSADQPWSIDETPGLISAAEFNIDDIDVVLADEHQPDAFIKHIAAQQRPIMAPSFDPEACLRLAHTALEHGHTIDPLELAPLYPREPEAVTLWNERHGNKA